jgi:hypothetical protein
VKGASLLPDADHSIRVSYDPTLPGSTEATLILTTAHGKEAAFTLRGIRNELPKAAIGLGAPSATSIIAGDEISVPIQFESAVGDTAAPSTVEIKLGYNTDMLAFAAADVPTGWEVIESKETGGSLLLQLRSSTTSIKELEPFTSLKFKSYLAADESSTMSISHVACNPVDAGFSTCTLETTIGSTNSISVGAGCGLTELRKSLRNTKSVSVIARPNPIVGVNGRLSIHVASTASEPNPLSIGVDFVDRLGKVMQLNIDRELTKPEEDLDIPLDGISAGSYIMRTHIGDEIQSTQIIVIK